MACFSANVTFLPSSGKDVSVNKERLAGGLKN